jgi:NAD(P)-dependent dehydrogenase (short-subunit alcohol dehydrogenase family)
MRAFVTGGGRGIGAGIARALADDGWEVVVGARSREQVEAVAEEIGGDWVEVDVADRRAVERAAAQVGEVDLLVANAGVDQAHAPSWEIDPDEWWRVYEINVLGVHLCCRAVIPAMLERGRGRIVITASGAAYLPGGDRTAYPPSKAAVCRYGETLANELAGLIPVFFFSPGLVRTEMTEGMGLFNEDAPWTPPELAPELVRKLATGRYDALAGRYLHAEHDDLDELLARIDDVRTQDLNAIRLRR